MYEQLVDFKTALLAAKAGFREETCTFFEINIEEEETWDSINIENQEDFSDFGDCEHYNYDFGNDENIYLSRPTQDLLDRWLRENHNVCFVVVPFPGGKYTWSMFNLPLPDLSKGSNNRVAEELFPDYEMAREAALREGLEMVIHNRIHKELTEASKRGGKNE